MFVTFPSCFVVTCIFHLPFFCGFLVENNNNTVYVSVVNLSQVFLSPSSNPGARHRKLGRLWGGKGPEARHGWGYWGGDRQLGDLGEQCKPPQQGLCSPSRNWNCGIFTVTVRSGDVGIFSSICEDLFTKIDAFDWKLCIWRHLFRWFFSWKTE